VARELNPLAFKMALGSATLQVNPAAWRYSPRSFAPGLAEASNLCPSSTAVEYRGVRYTLRARIEREQWYVAINPAGVEM
jgi:hypothetical protein